MLSYRRRSCCLLWLRSLCRSPRISGRTVLRGAGWSRGLWDLPARRWWALGENHSG